MLILLITLLVIATGVALAVLIPKDGYGTRPGPRSHVDSFPPNSFV
ncbi:hypothetical protein [Aeromicrobium sp. Root236]|nr:hypothetical protein [Aeromicrobium sp. Root236]